MVSYPHNTWDQPAHRSPIRIYFDFEPWKLPWIIHRTIYRYTPYIEKIVELCKRRESEFGIDQIDSLPFGLLRTAHLHHIPSQCVSPLSSRSWAVCTYTGYSVLVQCVTDVNLLQLLRNILQLCYVGPKVHYYREKSKELQHRIPWMENTGNKCRKIIYTKVGEGTLSSLSFTLVWRRLNIPGRLKLEHRALIGFIPSFFLVCIVYYRKLYKCTRDL